LLLSLPVFWYNQRVNYLYTEILQKKENRDEKSNPRIMIWKSAVNIIKKHKLIGVGIGDVKKELVDEYERIGEKEMAAERLNCHNQYLEIMLENGIIGLLIFLTLIGTMFYISFSEKNLLYSIFILIMIVFFIFESVLKRLPGITFFALFSFLLMQINTAKIPDY
jgi:O-antigen ligase